MLELSMAACLTKIQTTIDGGWRVTFDLPDSESENIARLSRYRDKPLGLGIVDGGPREQGSGSFTEEP